MGRNLYKLIKIFDDVIVILILLRLHHFDMSQQLKSGRLLRVLAEYLKNGSIDFHQTQVMFWAIIYSIFWN